MAKQATDRAKPNRFDYRKHISRWSLIVGLLLLFTGLVAPVMGVKHISAQLVPSDNTWSIKSVSSWSPPTDLWAWGRPLAIAVDSAANTHIAYYKPDAGEIRYVFVRAKNGAMTDELVTSSAGTFSVSIALRSDDTPCISYGDGFYQGNMMFAEKKGGSWEKCVVDRGSFYAKHDSILGNAGAYSSLVIDSDDEPHIAYNDGGQYVKLRYAYRANGKWITTKVDSEIASSSSGGIGSDVSLVLDRSDRPLISSRSQHGSSEGSFFENGRLVLSNRLNSGGWDTVLVLPNDLESLTKHGGYASMALDKGGFPVIASYDENARQPVIASKNSGKTNDFSIWKINMPSYPLDYGKHITLKIDSQDNRHVAFYDGTTQSLVYSKFPHRTDSFQRIESGGAGRFAALALDKYGNPQMVYYNSEEKTIKLATLDR